MRIPAEPILLAAKRWLMLLPSAGEKRRAFGLLTTLSTYSDLSTTQYSTALAWLEDMGLLDEPLTHVPPERAILDAVFEFVPQLWGPDADQLVQSPDELPLNIISIGKVLGLEAETVFGQLKHKWGKVDTALRQAVGSGGELALVSLLDKHVQGSVEHVATWSDGFGYDIAVEHRGVSAHLEVKSTTRTGRFTAYLSRHEYEVMLRDPFWQLVGVKLDSSLDILGIGTISKKWILENAPVDVNMLMTWASVKLEIPADAVQGGIPLLQGVLPPSVSRW